MDRAQAHTLEALTASLVLLAGVVFVVQTSAAPLATGAANKELGSQQRATANSFLTALDGNGSLRRAVTDWDTTGQQWENTTGGEPFSGAGPPNAFGETLNETFIDEGLAVNVDVAYRTADGGEETEQLVFMGSPSDTAVRASHLVVLHNDTAFAGDRAATVGEAASKDFYAPDAAPERTLFNVLEVRVTVW